MPVSFNDLMLAFEFVGSSDFGENEAFLCKQSGAIHWRSRYVDDLEALPDDIDDSDKYIQIPGKSELDLGKSQVMDFAYQHLPDDFDHVRRIFSKKGAYARFKDLLE